MTTPTVWPAPTSSSSSPPVRPEPRIERVRRAVVAVAAAGAMGALIGIGRPAASVGAVMLIAVVGAATSSAGLLPRPSRVVLAVGLLAFLPWLAIRSSPWLLVPNVVAALVLVGVALSMRNGAGPTDSLGGYVERLGTAVQGAVETPSHVHLGVRTALPAERRAFARRSVRPLLGGVAVAFVTAAILASGDAVFASYVDLGEMPASTARRFLGAVLLMAITSVAVGVAIASDDRPPIPARRFIVPRSAIIALGPIVAVYASFVAVQLSTVVLGADYVQSRSGLTYAEYARSGFFQLVVVAVATFLGILLLRPTTRCASPRERRTILALVGTVAASTVAMAVAAIVKLQLYADVFGLTMLRLHTTVFAAWLVVAVGVTFFSLVRSEGEWVVPTVAATALVGVFAMNVVNPEAVVAEHNLGATITSEEFDIGYITSLSDDVVPVVVGHVDRLEPPDRERALRTICAASTVSTDGLDWNWSRAAAARARASVC